MAALPKLIRRPTIGSRLVSWFLIIALVPCGILTFLFHTISSFQIDQTARRNCQIIAESKAGEVEAVAQEKIRSIKALGRSQALVDATIKLASAFSTNAVGPESSRRLNARPINAFLARTAEAYHYRDFFLVSPAGQVLFGKEESSRAVGKFINRGSLTNSELANVFNRAKTLVEAEISDFQIYRGQPYAHGAEPALFIAGPVLQGQTVVGVMIFRLDNGDIYAVFNNYLGLGRTGEVMVGSKSGNDVMVIAPIRHDDQPWVYPFRKFASPSGLEDPLSKAARGNHGNGRFTDYRGVRCIGFWTYLPLFRWGLVVKQDASEALAPLEIERRAALFLLSLVIVPVILAAFLIARNITRPIQLAARTAQRVAAGDLTTEFTIRKMDETGQLLLAIRSMTAKLRDHYETLEEKIRQRTRELEESNRDLLTARKAADEANRAKTAFLANMSHELRTPMNAIIGYSEMLIEESADSKPAEFVPDLERVLGAARHLLALINDILDLSKIEAGKTELFLEHFEIKPLVADVVAIIEPLANRNGNRLQVDCPDSIGVMRADLTKVRQGLFNLLSNACKFTRGGSVTLRVNSRNKSGVEWIDFEVSDSGIGMSQEQLLRLFKPFSQADVSTTRKYGGTGLGLSISRMFARMMGGEVDVRSDLGHGTTFTFSLPRDVEEAKAGCPPSVGTPLS